MSHRQQPNRITESTTLVAGLGYCGFAKWTKSSISLQTLDNPETGLISEKGTG